MKTWSILRLASLALVFTSSAAPIDRSAETEFPASIHVPLADLDPVPKAFAKMSKDTALRVVDAMRSSGTLINGIPSENWEAKPIFHDNWIVGLIICQTDRYVASLLLGKYEILLFESVKEGQPDFSLRRVERCRQSVEPDTEPSLGCINAHQRTEVARGHESADPQDLV